MVKKKVFDDAGEVYRLAQVQKLRDLFKGANSRVASTLEELEEWVASPAGALATAFDRDENGQIIPDLTGSSALT
jgi:hypothetical protein